MRKAYFGPHGAQIHYRACGPDDAPPLLLLPPSPHSSLYFTSVMPLLAKHYRVIAIDYPGFGGSDALEGEASIQAFANALSPLLATFGPADICGFHTGNLAALELALTQPALVKNIVMIDVPYFTASVRADLDEKIGRPAVLPCSVDDLAAGFETNIIQRRGDMGAERAFQIWAEGLRAGAGRNAAFHAAFTYPSEDKFAALEKPVQIIATQSGLLAPSRAAAKAAPNANLTEALQIDRAVFERYKTEIVGLIKAALKAGHD